MTKKTVSKIAIIGAIIVVILVSVFAARQQKQVNPHAKPAKNAPTRPTYHLVIKDHRFIPDQLVVPAQTRFFIVVENQDDRVDEFESYDMKFERILAPSRTRKVHAGPLHLGRSYVFFDDFHPDQTRGHVIVKPQDE